MNTVHFPRWAILALLLTLWSATTLASDIVITDAEVGVRNDIVMLQGNCHFEFSEDALDALNSGIPLYFDLEVRFARKRRFLWDPEVYATQRRFVVERHALSERFILTDVTTEQRSVHASLERAIDELGRIRDLPLIEYKAFEGHSALSVELRFRLDINALPAPMIPLAYVSPGWRMSSGWYRWQADL